MHRARAEDGTRLRSIGAQIDRIRRRLNRIDGLSQLYWNWRRIILIAGVPLSFAAFKLAGDITSIIATLTWVAVFVVVARYHRPVRDSITRYQLWLEIKSTQLARMKLDWSKIPPALARVPDPHHPFEVDLDITGERSLHRLIDVCVTEEGSARLMDWLLKPIPDALVIHERRTLVQDLSRLRLFRDRLQLVSALAAAGTKSRWHARGMVDWLQAGTGSRSLPLVLSVLLVLSATNITLLVLGYLSVLPNIWPITFLIYVTIMILNQKQVAPVLGVALSLEGTLTKFRAVSLFLENYRYGGSRNLARVCAPYLDAVNRPSVYLKRVERIVSAVSLRGSAPIWLAVHAVVPWDFFFVYRLNKCRAALATLFPAWLDVLFELEALNSLANFTYLNPGHTFPVINEAGPVGFHATQLGHPLLPFEERVCNDITLDETNRIAIITGSNMAGKSTFLRSMGVNLCLAYAGAPVVAAAMDISLFGIFTCIKVSDSVTEGLSYFYAEVKRLRALLTAVEDKDGLPVFFLIDEIFRGTNNRERQIGGYSYVRRLAASRAIGAVATHDLEMVKLAGLTPHISNYHFREEVRDGLMVFDYKLRSGPCPTTNALKIMQLEGLPVDQYSEGGATL
jgi:hypothetical protein